MTNPYEAPRSEVTAAKNPNRHWRLNIWLFAIAWPPVVICMQVAARRLSLPAILAWAGLPIELYWVISGLPVMFGYAVCIVAAVRYRASKRVRVLRAAASIVLLLVFGNLLRMALRLAFPTIF